MTSHLRSRAMLAAGLFASVGVVAVALQVTPDDVPPSSNAPPPRPSVRDDASLATPPPAAAPPRAEPIAPPRAITDDVPSSSASVARVVRVRRAPRPNVADAAVRASRVSSPPAIAVDCPNGICPVD